MKKFACLVLALAMVFSLSISAGAVTAKDIGADGGSTNKDVTVKVNPPEVADVYHVVVKWDTTISFTYSFAAKTWNPETHTYSNGGGWDKTQATITVINHSNVAVNATLSFTENDLETITMITNPSGNDNVIATLSASTLALGSAVDTGIGEAGTDLDGDDDNAPAGTVTLTIEGTPEKEIENTITKNITVKIDKKS